MRRKIDIILGSVLVALSWLFVGASLGFLFIPDMPPSIAVPCVMLVVCLPGSALAWEWIFGRPKQGADRHRSAMLRLSIAHGLVLAFVTLGLTAKVPSASATAVIALMSTVHGLVLGWMTLSAARLAGTLAAHRRLLLSSVLLVISATALAAGFPLQKLYLRAGMAVAVLCSLAGLLVGMLPARARRAADEPPAAAAGSRGL